VVVDDRCRTVRAAVRSLGMDQEPMSEINSKFSPRDRVYIDGCKGLVAVVTAVQWRNEHQISYEVSWVSDADSKSVLIEEWRLSLASSE
jgi:hypothetical protein